MENIYVVGNRANYDWLMESEEQLEQGDFSSHKLIEAPEMNKVFTKNGLEEDYLYWSIEDRKKLKR